MRYLWAVLMMVMMMLLGAASATANHFPPPFEYLNGTVPLEASQCFDTATKEWHLCRVYLDTFGQQAYLVRFHGKEVIRVLRIRGGNIIVLYGDPLTIPRESQR